MKNCQIGVSVFFLQNHTVAMDSNSMSLLTFFTTD